MEERIVTSSPNLMSYLIAFGGLTEDDYELVPKSENPRQFYMLTREDHTELLMRYKADVRIQMFLAAFRDIQGKFTELRNNQLK